MHRDVPVLSDEALAALEAYVPGQRARAERARCALALADGDVIKAEDLQLLKHEARPHLLAAAAGQPAPTRADQPYDTASSPALLHRGNRARRDPAGAAGNRYNKTRTAAALASPRALRYKSRSSGRLSRAARRSAAAAPEQQEGHGGITAADQAGDAEVELAYLARRTNWSQQPEPQREDHPDEEPASSPPLRRLPKANGTAASTSASTLSG